MCSSQSQYGFDSPQGHSGQPSPHQHRGSGDRWVRSAAQLPSYRSGPVLNGSDFIKYKNRIRNLPVLKKEERKKQEKCFPLKMKRRYRTGTNYFIDINYQYEPFLSIPTLNCLLHFFTHCTLIKGFDPDPTTMTGSAMVHCRTTFFSIQGSRYFTTRRRPVEQPPSLSPLESSRRWRW